MDFEIKEARTKYKITQKDLLEITDIPLRTIENWESGKRQPSPWVKKLIISYLDNLLHNDFGIITEKKGYYTIGQIKHLLLPLIFNYDISRIILFGSYSKGIQDARSDIDLVIDGNIRGLDFIRLLEDISNLFVKSVDVIHLSQVKKNTHTYNEIVKGTIIYDIEKAKTVFTEANTEYHTISNYDVLKEVAVEQNYIKEEDIDKLNKWKTNPSNPSWMK